MYLASARSPSESALVTTLSRSLSGQKPVLLTGYEVHRGNRGLASNAMLRHGKSELQLPPASAQLGHVCCGCSTDLAMMLPVLTSERGNF